MMCMKTNKIMTTRHANYWTSTSNLRLFCAKLRALKPNLPQVVLSRLVSCGNSHCGRAATKCLVAGGVTPHPAAHGRHPSPLGEGRLIPDLLAWEKAGSLSAPSRRVRFHVRFRSDHRILKSGRTAAIGVGQTCSQPLRAGFLPRCYSKIKMLEEKKEFGEIASH
jgi:hypothetical protein